MGTRIAVMKNGVSQQLGTPQKIYSHPANIFVAGSIGSPAMNFFDVDLSASDGGIDVQNPTSKWKIEGPSARALTSQVGKETVLGVRPEQFSHRPADDTREWIGVPSMVEVTESMGSEQYVYCSTGGQSYVARLDAQVRAVIGESMTGYFRKKDVRLFDKATTSSLLQHDGLDR